MAETDQNDQAGSDRNVIVHRMYIKDASFEAPNSPEVFSGNWEPKITLNIKTESSAAREDRPQSLGGLAARLRRGGSR